MEAREISNASIVPIWSLDDFARTGTLDIEAAVDRRNVEKMSEMWVKSISDVGRIGTFTRVSRAFNVQ